MYYMNAHKLCCLPALNAQLGGFWLAVNVFILYYGAVECLNPIGWRNFIRCAILFRETHGEGIDRIKCPYHFAKILQ